MILRHRTPDGRNLDKDMGPRSPYTGTRRRIGAVPVWAGKSAVTKGGVDWGNKRRRKKKA